MIKPRHRHDLVKNPGHLAQVHSEWSSTIKPRRILRSPSHSAWWLAVIAVGLVSPVTITALIHLGGYYPIGSWLPVSALLTEFGIILAVSAVAAGVLLAAPLYALLAWSWRPIALAVLFEFCLLVGFVPARIIGELMQRFAFASLQSRSSELVKAISTYTDDKGTPPATLAQLVPNYLTSVPRTGMALARYYKYETDPGLCERRSNPWNLSVSVSGFLAVHQLFYCPEEGGWFYEVSD